MRLSIVASHPIQYYAPWFRYIAEQQGIELKVHYLWDFGVSNQKDVGFGTTLRWDIPLLDGYEHEFVPNVATNRGTSHYNGLINPTLRERLEDSRADAVLFMLYRYRATLPLIMRWRGAPLLFRGDSHRLAPRHGLKEKINRFVVKKIFQRFSACLYVGKANREYYRYHGVPEEKLFFSPHSVDNERFYRAAETDVEAALKFREDLGIPADAPVLLFAGKFQELKKPLDLLHAFKAANVPGAFLLFVGQGELEGALKEAAKDDASIRFAPFQNQSQIPRTLMAGDALALTSNRETWGLIINEGMCLGRAAITSDLVGCAQDLIIPGETGYTFPTGDRAALAKVIAELLSDRSRLSIMGQKARKHIENYSYKQATEGLFAALQAVKR